MSDEDEETSRRRRCASPAVAPAFPPDDDDLLWEIFLRLPPLPSSLPRPSLVCKRWRRLATDPGFLRRFRARHRKAPILGAFCHFGLTALFCPILRPPDRIPQERFSLRPPGRSFSLRGASRLVGCRHGRVLMVDRHDHEVVVLAPVTGEYRRVAIPPEFKGYTVCGTVLCAAGEQSHVHGGCHSSPYRVVLVHIVHNIFSHQGRAIARVYSSETGIWGSLVSTSIPYGSYILGDCHGTLVASAVYWLTDGAGYGILEFDLDRQSLAVIKFPPVVDFHSHHIIKADDGLVGLSILSYPNFQMWDRKVNCRGISTWLLRKTVRLDQISGLEIRSEAGGASILGYEEDHSALFLQVDTAVFVVELESMQSKKVLEMINKDKLHTFYPFTSFFAPGVVSTLSACRAMEPLKQQPPGGHGRKKSSRDGKPNVRLTGPEWSR